MGSLTNLGIPQPETSSLTNKQEKYYMNNALILIVIPFQLIIVVFNIGYLILDVKLKNVVTLV